MSVRARFTAIILLILSIAAAASAAQSVKERGNGGRREGHTKGTGRKQAGKQPEAVPYQSGEVRVTVQGNRNPVVPLGLALNGVTLVEFPESDLFFAVHPPENGDLVCVEKSPSMKGDHHLVLRAG